MPVPGCRLLVVLLSRFLPGFSMHPRLWATFLQSAKSWSGSGIVQFGISIPSLGWAHEQAKGKDTKLRNINRKTNYEKQISFFLFVFLGNTNGTFNFLFASNCKAMLNKRSSQSIEIYGYKTEHSWQTEYFLLTHRFMTSLEIPWVTTKPINYTISSIIVTLQLQCC